MNRIEELLQEKCPRGVEYKSIGDIAIDIYRGSGIKQDEVVDSGIPCVRYGEIYTTYGIWFDSCVSHTTEEKIKSKKYFEYGDILFAITGESVEDIAKSCAYVGHETCLAGGDIVVLKHSQNPKYLAYVLDTKFAKKQKSKGKIKSKVVHSSVPDIKKIIVPIPPIEVQDEIVSLLDEYSSARFSFIEAIESEIDSRKKQFEILRAQLFDAMLGEDYDDCIIKDVCKRTSSGGTPKTSHPEYYGGDIPWLRTQEVDWQEIRDTGVKITEDGLNNSSAKWIPARCVIVAMYGATAAKTAINGIPLTTNQACCNLEIDETRARVEYVYHWLKKEYQTLKALGRGSQNNINADIIKSFPILVPSLEVQDKLIVAIEELESDFQMISNALQQEIELRLQQYSYCSEKLLSLPKRIEEGGL